MATDATYALRTSSDDTHTADDQMPSPTYRSLQTKYSSKMAAAGLGQAESRCPAADAFEHRTSGSLHSPGESPGASGSSGFSSSLLDQAPEEAISAMFDQRVTLLVSTLDTLRTKCEVLTEQAAESSSLCSSYATRCACMHSGCYFLFLHVLQWTAMARRGSRYRAGAVRLPSCGWLPAAGDSGCRPPSALWGS